MTEKLESSHLTRRLETGIACGVVIEDPGYPTPSRRRYVDTSISKISEVIIRIRRARTSHRIQIIAEYRRLPRHQPHLVQPVEAEAGSHFLGIAFVH